MTAPEMREIAIQIPTAVAQKMAETFDGTLEDAALAGLKLIHGMGIDHYNLLQDMAKQLGTSVPKTLRTAIAELQAQADKATPAPAPLGRPKINTDRDTAIYLRVSEGATQAEVAHAFGISIVRIGQIMAHQRAIRGVTSKRGARATVQEADKPAPTSWPGHTGAPREQGDFKARTRYGNMFFKMDAGATAEDAAQEYNITADQARAGYAAYRAACSPNASRGEKVVASFAGVHAIESYGQEVLTLKDSEAQAEDGDAPTQPKEPAKPRYVMPALEALKAKRAEPEDNRTAIERNVFDPEFGF